MNINWSNVGVLEILLICLMFFSLFMTIRDNNRISAIGKIVASLSLLIYALLNKL